MLNKDLERRYNTAEKVVRDLNEFLAKDSWQEEVEEARKAFMKQEADRSFKGIKGAIGSSERIKAVRERVDEHIALKKERKAAKVRRSKQRTKVTWLRTGFVCLVLISLMAVVFSDHTSITRIKGMFSKIGIGGVDNLSVSQNGRQIIVEWDTAELTSCQIRLLAPVAQNFYTESNSKFVLHHSCIVEGAFADGATLEFIIIDNDGTESPIYTHIFQYKPLIDKFAIDCGVVTAFVDIATRDVSNCTLNIKSASRGGALLTPVASESTTSQTSSPHSLFFVSQCPAKKHSFSISALPSGKDYIAELKITCPPSRPGAALVVEKSMRKFSTKEPEFTDLFVVPSGKQITATPLVTDNELIFSSDDCFLYSISPGNGNLLWKVSTGTPVAGSPVMENNVIILNLVNGTIMGVNRTDGSVLWSLTTPFPWSQTPALSGNGLMCLISAKGRISIWSISEQKEKSFVETGREINCPPLFADGFIYVVDSLGYLSCRNGSTGLELWNYRTGNKLLATPSVWDKYLFLPAMDSNFYVIYRNRGVVSWRKHLGNSSAAVAQVKEAGSSPGQSEVNILYLIAQSKDITRLVKINAFGGTTLWDVSVEKNLKGTPVISEGRVYAAGTDGVLHCYSAVDGLKLWSLDTGTEISGAPFVTEGYIFVANYKGSIIRIRD
jgi:outer membrane protein assembly factor BamB